MKDKSLDTTRRGFLRKSLGTAGGLGLALSLPVLNGCEETTVNLVGNTTPVIDNELKLDVTTEEFEALATIGSLVSVNTTGPEGEMRLMVFRVSETEATTMTRKCTHVGCDLSITGLSSGVLIDEDTVECGCHGSQFNLATGEVEKGPASANLQTYPTTIEGNIITIKLA